MKLRKKNRTNSKQKKNKNEAVIKRQTYNREDQQGQILMFWKYFW